MGFYRVRVINGNPYVYYETRRREGRKVRSRSVCLGRVEAFTKDNLPGGMEHGTQGNLLRFMRKREPGELAMEKMQAEHDKREERLLVLQQARLQGQAARFAAQDEQWQKEAALKESGKQTTQAVEAAQSQPTEEATEVATSPAAGQEGE
ncbi:hypothetical protein [Rhodoplanes sp. Z2-YC6860]|uniref:hypothetical protein n=1 Tax=Rhodoplanes sp. Z2-YC6860 TaxID=674703 RepID=UPI0012EE24B9|nr:hypothetical protein [Rhodoplanes sp. Z2-YC6860]